LLHELDARMILIEFNNYAKEDIGKDEVNQPSHAAHLKRNTVYSEEGKVIVFLTVAHLAEMLHMRERGEDPADLIMDAIERFYIEWE
jgi:hypothetical protein